MKSQKRPRACENCQTLKIKCEGYVELQPCQRCARLGKECLPAAPKRQKDRVAELEAKVDALTRLLQAQGITDVPDDGGAPNGSESQEDRFDSVQTTPSASGSAQTDEGPSKKRRYNAVTDGNSKSAETLEFNNFMSSSDATAYSLFSVDAIVPLKQQKRLLEYYATNYASRFAAVPVANNVTLETLRNSKPTLLRALLFAASPGVLSQDDTEKMTNMIINELANKAVVSGEKSIELVQAITVVCLWYRAPRHHQSLAAYQLTQLACGMATGIGLGGPHSSPSVELVISGDDITTPEAWRTWLGCYTLSCSMATLLRRTNAQSWTNYHNDCISLLESSPQALPSDRFLCQTVYAERLCDDIATELAFSNLDVAFEPSALTLTTQRLQGRISEWSAQVPVDLRTPKLMIWQHVMRLYLHEPVLHTTTNKHSFAAPYIADRITIEDVATPQITPEHVASLYSLRDAAHALLDTFCMLGPPEVIAALPTMYYSARALYAMYVLAKLYVAVTISGNTFGVVLRADDLKLEDYLRKLMNLAEELNKYNAVAAPARLVSSSFYMNKWLETYKISLTPSVAAETADVSAIGHNSMQTAGDYENLWLGSLFDDMDWLMPYQEGDP